MMYGVNYPKGPVSWGREIGLSRVVSILSHLQALTGDMRYRPSVRLRQAAGV
jgi:3-hydroxybutyryl-CoA dehydrogenase